MTVLASSNDIIFKTSWLSIPVTLDKALNMLDRALKQYSTSKK